MPHTVSCAFCSAPLTFGADGTDSQASCPRCGAKGDVLQLTQARRGSLSRSEERAPDEAVHERAKSAQLLMTLAGGAVLLMILGSCVLGGYLIWFGLQR